MQDNANPISIAVQYYLFLEKQMVSEKHTGVLTVKK